jgi:hypothetical protein
MAVRVVHSDRGVLRRATTTSAGFLRGSASLTRTGVFKYRNADGSISRQLRHPDEVFSPASLASLQNAPLTLGHPRVSGGLLTADNAKDFAVGSVSNVRREGDFVRGDYLIVSQDAIDAAHAGVNEISCGYTCIHDETPGVWEGEPYDLIQREIEYNHVAQLDEGRAGPNVRLDSKDAFECVEEMRDAQESEEHMKKIKLDGGEYEVSESAAQAISNELNKIGAERDAAKTSSETLKAKLDGATDEIAKLKAASSDAAIAKRVKDRVDLESKARGVLGSNFDAADKSDAEIKIAVIKHVSPTFDAADKSPDYVAARFDGAIELHATRDAADADAYNSNVRAAVTTVNVDGKDEDAEARRLKMIERNRTQHATSNA